MNRYYQFVLTLLAIVTIQLSTTTGASATSHEGLLRTYPMNGSIYASPSTSVGLTFRAALDPAAIRDGLVSVRGSVGGSYEGSLKLSVDHSTLIFTPSQPFAFGEQVTVTTSGIVGADGLVLPPVRISFTIRATAVGVVDAIHSDDPMLEAVFGRSDPSRSRLSTQGLPLMTVINDDDPSDGRLYMASIASGGSQSPPYLLELDKSAGVLFSRQPGPGPVYDFVAHPNATYSFFNAPVSKYYILDSNYVRFDTLGADNGYQTDPHELLYHPDGSYDLIAIDLIRMDMRPFVPNGDSNALVMDNLVQEFDKKDNLIFEWRGLDHFKVTDIENEPGAGPMPVDYSHMNGLELDTDGNLLISSRHMDEITKIDRATGQIMWRFGGKNNQFTFSGDTLGFSHQHCIRSTPLGTYLLFDNGNYRSSGGQFSRAVEYKLDTAKKTATQIWEFRHDPPLFAAAMGSVQRLRNGNTLIGWGLNLGVAVTELGPFNRTVFELKLDSTYCNYRAYKFPEDYRTSGLGVTPRGHSVAASLQCIPNPARDRSEIGFTTVADGPVRVSLYDALGREVRVLYEGVVAAGSYTSALDGQGLAAGMYLIRVVSPAAAPMTAQIVITK